MKRILRSKPISQQLRAVRASTEKPVVKSSSILSIDEQIAALERGDASASGSGSDSDYDDDDDNGFETADSLLVAKDENGNVLKLVSLLQQQERIAPLRKDLLPGIQCSTTKKYSRGRDEPAKKESKKRIKFSDESSAVAQGKSGNEKAGARDTGLEATVRELLRQYEPASLEKRPFYCRVCKFQGASTEELDEHRRSEYHLVATGVERKMSTCRLCRKEFTSPDQLKEHLAGKAHIQRLERVQQNSADRKKFC